MKNLICTYLSLPVFFFSFAAEAAPSSLTYQGRIIKSDGSPLQHNNVSFLFEITSNNGTCVIYREQKSGIDMTNSQGIFDVPIGTGSKFFPASPTKTLLSVFDNGQTHDCADPNNNVVSTYTPTEGHTRLLRVQFHDGSGWNVISPDNEIRTVPFSAYAASSSKLGTKTENDFVLKTGVPTCSSNEFLSWNGTAMICAPVTGASGGTVTNVTSANSYITITNNNSTPLVTLNTGTTAGTVAAGNDSRFTDARIPTGTAGGDLSGTYPNPSVAKLQGVAISNAAPTSGYFFKFDGIQWGSSAIAIGDVTNLTSTLSGYHTISAFNTAVGSANCAAYQTPYWNSVSGSFQCQSINVSVAGDVSGSIGAVSVNKIKGVDVDTTGLTSGQILKYDGTKWAPATDSNTGGTVTNIATGTGLTGGPITSTGTISLANTAVTAGSYTRANITVDAQGRLTAASNGASVNLATEVTGTLPITNGGTGQTSATAAFNGLSPSTTKGDLIVHDGANDVRLPVGTDGQVLSANSAQTSGLQWITPTNGTVTNVTGTAPIVVATGSTTPAISINDATTSTKGAVQIGAGIAVSSGTISADPANFPSAVPVAKGGTGATSLTANRLIASNSTGAALTTFNCAVGQLVTFDAAGVMGCTNYSASGIFANGGNSFGTDATLGTNDAFALGLETNNATRMTITSAGLVGIGTSAPTTALDVNGYLTSSSTAIATGLWFKPSDTASTYTNTADEKQIIFATTGMSGGDTTFGYKMSWRNSDGSYRKDSMIMHKDGHVYFSGGNVGIGTTTSTNRLTVQDSSSIGSVGSMSGSGAILKLVEAAGTNELYLDGNTVASTNPTGMHIANLSTTPTIFTTSDTERMRIQASGNVGIGTTTPASKLEVNGRMIRSLQRATGASYVYSITSGTLTGRTLTFTKDKAASDVHIRYTETVGIRGTDAAQCIWEVKIDGASCTSTPIKMVSYVSGGFGQMNPGFTEGFCSGLTAGSHTVTVVISSSANTTYCYNGYQGASWSITAEEVN